jgi:DNA-binding CsgD family transcriptional regulator/ligand-binding sensor domain-containing protein
MVDNQICDLYSKLHILYFRYNKSLFNTLLLLLLQGQILLAAYGSYPIRNFTPVEYRAGIQNIDFAQNRDMSVYVANNLGVLSYNGEEWARKDFRTGKKKRSLAFDEHTNRLYVGMQGEFGYFEQNWEYVSLVDKVPADHLDFDEVWDVFLLEGKAYFCTFQGIYLYDGEAITVLTAAEGLERSFLVHNTLFTQGQDGSICRIEGPQLKAAFPQHSIEGVLAGMIPAEGGYLLFYNSGDITYTNGLVNVPRYENLIKALRGTYVNHVLQLSDTRLAIATQTAGLFLFDLQSRVVENISTLDGLATNACLRAFQDYYGNLWVGMQNGIALIRMNSPMRLLGEEINLQGSGYEAFETTAGTYYTTSSGIYYLAKDKKECVFIEGTEGPAYGIQEIAGRLYAGHHTGLFMLEKERGIRVARIDGVWQVKQLRSRPAYAIGGTYFGLYLFKIKDDKTLAPIKPISGFGLSSRFFEEDMEGKIWVGQYYQGLYQLTLSDDLSAVEVEKQPEESEHMISEQILLNRLENGLYLATASGLYQLEAEKGSISPAELFSAQIGQQAVYLVAQDQKNNIHVLMENEVGFFRKISAENYQYVPSSLYQLRYHLNNDLLHASVNVKQGILFAANEGFVHYTPELEDQLKIEQPLIIREVYSVTEDSALYAQAPFEGRAEKIPEIWVSPSDKVLKISIEAFQFNDLNSMRFRYYLKGFDEAFGEWTDDVSKEYTNLKAGKYEFVAQARNYLGEVYTSPVLHLEVQPPFYLSFAAKVFYLLCGLLVVFTISRVQKRRYKLKANEIDEKRKLEVSREHQKRARIEQEKEKELLQLKEEKVKNELQHVNKLLAASTMNLVVKNEFIESIKHELQEVRKNGKQGQETKRALEKIVKEIDTTLKLQEDWEQFEYHFERVHSDFLSRLQHRYPDLSPNEQKLCTLLRLNLNTKEIANLLSISTRGVEVARYRLRKKLNLEKGQNLSKFILEY